MVSPAVAAASAAAAPRQIGDAMAFLNDVERARIEDAVGAAEQRTTCEFVTVIAAASGHYLYLPTLIAAGIVFALSGLVPLLPFSITFEQLYAGQVIGFIALSLLFRWPPIKMRLVPRPAQRRQAHLLAHEQFLDLGLSSTSSRTGIMLFVSVAERYVEIIVDRGIQAKIESTVWQRLVDEFVAYVRANRTADGFVKSIEAATRVLAVHFPWHEGDVNELPNRVIEIHVL